MPRNLNIALQAIVFAALLSGQAGAKTTKGEAPAPPAVPVPKVDSEALIPPGPSKLEGTAQAVDGDEIRVGDSMVRLYGIAAPEMSGRLGPEARLALDGLIGGQRVTCQVFGKTPQGDAVGQCLAGTTDPAETLLSRGLAAVYRSGNGNDGAQQALAEKYDAAETLARKQAVGLWQPPVPPADPQVATQEQQRARVLGYAGFALLILAIFTVSITRVSIARRDRIERARLRDEQRTTLSFAMAAEVEIVLATTRKLIDQLAGLPEDRPAPAAVSATLALASTPFWNANAERLYLLPVEVTVPLLRFHALYEDAVRKLAVASAVPSGTLTVTLKALVEVGTAAVTAVEASLGIVRPPEPASKPSAAPLAPPSPPSSELKSPASAATN
ncbi:thermonuclease family protein [Dongia sedimenti]|uniref:Thermonuclease family protein n=1 Tax=Dongia sedimenti TaxID=3064282 RepID=A0ABU0YSZ7_9PROT|nr:thermonuclease family protein [Rhodospirillaceae bacterium R-7]